VPGCACTFEPATWQRGESFGAATPVRGAGERDNMEENNLAYAAAPARRWPRFPALRDIQLNPTQDYRHRSDIRPHQRRDAGMSPPAASATRSCRRSPSSRYMHPIYLEDVGTRAGGTSCRQVPRRT